MSQGNPSAPLRRGVFNTLAQSGTDYAGQPFIIVTGKGSDLTIGKAMKGRAKRKTISQTMMLSMVDVADKSGFPERKKSYWNTYHCQSQVFTANGRLHGTYCKNRHCTLCCSIRKADIINRYLPVIQKWAEPYFVTLTVKSVPFYRLQPVMKAMVKEFKEIVETYRKRNQRGKGIKLVGIRSLESNFNAKALTYNPHFHCVVANKEMADILIQEWRQRSKPGWTNSKAQKKEKVSNRTIALIEIVKYGSKIFTEPDLNKKVKIKGKAKIYASALDNILMSMKGLRIFERFGFNLPKSGTDKNAIMVVFDYQVWLYHRSSFDWLSLETGNPLSCYDPPPELVHLLENAIDTDLV